jgi:hypothetical protein
MLATEPSRKIKRRAEAQISTYYLPPNRIAKYGLSPIEITLRESVSTLRCNV